MDHEEHDPETGAPAAGPHREPLSQAASSDPLLALRAELENVDELPLTERADVFDRTHAVVVRELRALELG